SWPSSEWFSLVKLYDLMVEKNKQIELKNTFESSVKTGNSFKIDALIKTTTNDVKWVRISGKGDMVNSNCVMLYGAIQDIHIHKLIEEEREDILESIT